MAFIILGAVVYLVTNYAGQIQEQIGVKGASTSRAKEIAGNITNDVGSQVNNAKNQAMHINLTDVMNYLSRFKRVPQDANSIKNYAQTQVTSVLQSKSKK
jgi:hypothetical protein